MEIKIESKRNNPLLNRTEVHFTVKHEGESTPNRELIRNELADKLNAKKENIIINYISSSFGNQDTTGYAKVYTSLKQSKDLERKHFLIRNKIISEEKKTDEKKKEEKSTVPEKKPGETSEPKKEEERTEEKPSAEEKTEESRDQPREEVTSETKKEEKKIEEASPGEGKTPDEGSLEGEKKEEPKVKDEKKE